MSRRLGLAVAAAVLGLLLGGCTGVPSSSSPQVVEPLTGQPSGLSVSAPGPETEPRDLVRQFLNLSLSGDTRGQIAQLYLTHEAYPKWSGDAATILDSLTVSNFVAVTSDTGSVTVSGRKIGSLDASGSGTYQPDLQGVGTGGARFTATFGLKHVPNAGWRIDKWDYKGVVLDLAAFQQMFHEHSLYFFDSSEKRLIADPRYTAITDPAQLASWLMTRLATGPRQELQNSTVTEVPTDPTSVKVTLGNPAKVVVPGAAQLDPKTRGLLAAQIATTLQPAYGGLVEMTDAGQPVQVPDAGVTFNASLYTDLVQPVASAPSLFYIVDGHVQVVNGDPIPSAAQRGYALTSVALARTSSPDLRIAATTGQGNSEQLLVGTVGSGIRSTAVRGNLSRPAWAPHLDEVWVGSGTALYRVNLAGKVEPVPMVAPNGTAVAGRVDAVRFSPDGTRIAVVLTSPSGSQIWVGAVVRQGSAGQVHVDSLVQISPEGVSMTDVAWNDQLALFAIGHTVDNGIVSVNVYEVQVDGSLWFSRGISGLPQAPDSITVAENEVAWVSAGGTLWNQQAGSWASPSGTETRGVNPVYLE